MNKKEFTIVVVSVVGYSIVFASIFVGSIG